MTSPEFTPEELATEEWRLIPSLEGHYSASTLGRIRREISRTSGKAKTLKKPGPHRDGYLMAALYFNGKVRAKMVHYFIAETFLGPRPNGHVVNHKDTNKKNNRILNLEYVTPKQNSEHAVAMGLIASGSEHRLSSHPELAARGEQNGNHKLTDDAVRTIKREYAAAVALTPGKRPYGIVNKLSVRHRVARHTVKRIVKGESWAHIN